MLPIHPSISAMMVLYNTMCPALSLEDAKRYVSLYFPISKDCDAFFA